MNKTNRKPVILDYLIALHIIHLNKYFDLKSLGNTSRVVSLCSLNPLTGKKEIAIRIKVNLNIDTGYDNDYADIQFVCQGRLITQRVELVAKPSGLRKGTVFFFKCPDTGQYRRTLYLYNGLFVSRKAIGHTTYLSKLESKKQSLFMKSIRKIMKDQKLIVLSKKPYFKRYHAGNLTKRYMRVLDAVDNLNRSW